ncbi:unnamed protein product [Acanthoscelides obtectus]|uniref:Uncharacterized protein n=1 Tax=Acanthoscelides obtectus TaxID=200917 RepID=A0A9P0PN14_ACAOB|nr:unnamed protein product [Acanthoscelides obtectus]CAK1662391.1 hypothetical protein AOBTE_LOCUS23122 [Acanthoscelides obtectus]
MSEKRSTSQLPKTSSSSSRRVDQPNQELPSTSGIKAEFNIKITITPDENRSLQSLDENMLKQKAEADDEGSFVTVPSFTKEIATSMEPAVIQIATKRHQSVAAVPMVMENVPPPPYYSAQSGPENNNRTSGPQSYLLYDMQKILGGRRIQLLPNEYILGAITLYTDIVVIFLNLFCVIGHGRFY